MVRLNVGVSMPGASAVEYVFESDQDPDASYAICSDPSLMDDSSYIQVLAKTFNWTSKSHSYNDFLIPGLFFLFTFLVLLINSIRGNNIRKLTWHLYEKNQYNEIA